MSDKYHKKFSSLVRRCEENEITDLKKNPSFHLYRENGDALRDGKGKPFLFHADFSYKVYGELVVCHHKDRNELVQIKLALLRQEGYRVDEY